MVFEIKKTMKISVIGFLILLSGLSVQSGMQTGHLFTGSAQVNSSLTMTADALSVENASIPAAKSIGEKLYVGGDAFGVKIFSDGVMVIGISEVETPEGIKSPAAEAGIRAKDIITEINGSPARRNEQVAEIFGNSMGEPIKVTVNRKGEALNMTIIPQKGMDGKFKAGLWVRDSMAGIGTFTFFDPQSKSFGGLGHGIFDVDTGDRIPIFEGTVVGAKIIDVKPGQKGTPGELIGVFEEEYKIGTVYSNTDAGVFGKYNSDYIPAGSLTEVGRRQDIKLGDATIISSASGVPKAYQIKITKILSGDSGTGKNMAIEAVDPQLLALTGGIVQGMSGSPILQNGKLIGAVTHVLINDPTRGYGIFIENMLKEVK